MGKKLVDPDKLCLGCMTELDEKVRFCPYCGFGMENYKRPKNSLPLQEILDGKYLVGRVIGIGGFGITYIGWDFYQGKKVCIKEYFPRSIAIRNPAADNYTDQISVSIQYSMEMQTQSQSQSMTVARNAYHRGLESYIKEAENLSHFYLMPGIVSVKDFFYGNRTAYIVMEYIDGIDMRKYAKSKGGRIEPEELFGILRDVLKALYKVHQAGIIHRDISPDNIMLSEKHEAKLIDFGAAKDFEKSKNAPVLLKHGYAPLEQYEPDGKQGPWTDIYSMCASIYYLLSGKKIPPAKEREKKDTVALLQVLGVPVSEEIDLAIKKGLSIQMENRYQSVAELYRGLYGEAIE